MAQIRKVGLLNLNDSFSFLQLKEKIDAFLDRLKRDNFEVNLVHLANSRPFTMNKYILEIKELIQLQKALLAVLLNKISMFLKR